MQSARRVCDLFDIKDADDWMDEVVDTVSDGRLWQGELRFTSHTGDRGWVEVILTPVYDTGGEVEDLLVLGTDITKRRMAEKSMDRKNRAEIEKKINQQKFRSVLILEAPRKKSANVSRWIYTTASGRC